MSGCSFHDCSLAREADAQLNGNDLPLNWQDGQCPHADLADDATAWALDGPPSLCHDLLGFQQNQHLSAQAWVELTVTYRSSRLMSECIWHWSKLEQEH